MADSSSEVTLKQPQTDKALDIKDPTNVDDTAVFVYDSSANFEISDFNTFIQDITNFNEPEALPNDIAPSTSPFILQINGSGFSQSPFSPDPFKIYAQLGDYHAIIPPLSTAADLSSGRVYGYQVKSDTTIWVYLNRLLAQEIWFIPKAPGFTGEINGTITAIETGVSLYPYLNTSIPDLKLYFAANNGKIVNKPNLLDDYADTSISIPITQTPYIVTIQAYKDQNIFAPFNVSENGRIESFLALFGHNISNHSVMMVYSASNLLQKNPSRLPQSVLDSDQSETTIRNMEVSKLNTLEYFKEGNFLNSLKTFATSDLQHYDYFASDGTVTNNGSTHLELPTEKFTINTLPQGTFTVVVYDKQTGIYSVAPNAITVNSQNLNLQVHDVSPSAVVLQSPQFTLNGFNFPTKEDVQNGATVSVYISDSKKNHDARLGVTASLTITQNSESLTRDLSGEGTINLKSTSSMVVSFDNLSFIPKPDDNKTIYLTVTVLKNFIMSNGISPPITLQSPPLIKFLTNGDSQPPDNSKALVRIDQKTGQVIAYGETGINALYIVGQNFGTKKDLTVLFNGQQQNIIDLFSWNNSNDPTLSAIVIQTKENGDIKGDATIEIRSNKVSSEPFVLIPVSTIFVPANNRTKRQENIVTKNEYTVGTSLFFDNIPYNHFSSDFTLWNNKNTKVSSSLAVKLQNFTTKKSVSVKAGLSIDNATSISFNPDLIVIPANTPLASDGSLNITFNVYGAFNVNFSSPKIIRLQHSNGNFDNPLFIPPEIMTVVGTGFTDGMRYNINETGWKIAEGIHPIEISGTMFQAFDVEVPKSGKKAEASVKISNDQDESVSSAQTSGKQNGPYQVNKTVVNDRYSPLLKINQRLPAGIKLYAKGPQITITDKIDANLSIYSQMAPFLSGFKTLLMVIRIIVCIIDVICALINPFQLIVAIIALMDCIIDLLSLFPQLAVPIMILSFLQNFIGFLQTFLQQVIAYVFTIVNSQLALVQAQLSKDFALLAATEQQAFAALKQIRDVIAFLEPALQIIQIFKDLLNFAMHFPCAGNQGSSQDDGTCPPGNVQKLIGQMIEDKFTPSTEYSILAGNMNRLGSVVTVSTFKANAFVSGEQIIITPGEINFPTGMKTIDTIVNNTTFTYTEDGINATSTLRANVGSLASQQQQQTLATMFCQAVAMQTATMQTMPGFNGLDSFGNPLPGGPLKPGSTSVVPNITPVLPNVAAAIECMNNLTDQIENALNAGQIFITTEEQGQKVIEAYTQCVQNLIDQTTQALGDTCVLAISAINSELKVSPKGSIAPDLSDDFVKTKIALPTTQPSDQQDAGLVLDLATITDATKIPSAITTDPSNNSSDPTTNFGLKQDVNTPIIVQTNNKSGHRQSKNTIYFNTDNSEVGSLIVPGDILELVGGPFGGLQFPILAVQQIFTAIRLTCKLDITFEQKLLIGEQPLPENLSGFDVKVIAHLAGNDAVAVVPADNISLATVHIIARDHHGHEIGTGLANKVAINIESGDAIFVPVTPSLTTDVTGVIQEEGTHYMANLKTECAGIVIVSASVCGVEFQDIGYHAKDPNHAITTRRKTVKIVFTPPIPKPTPGAFDANNKPQVPGSDIPN